MGMASSITEHSIMSTVDLKIVIVGDRGVGKSTIFSLLTYNRFVHSYKPASSVSIGSCLFHMDSMLISVSLWDVPGSDEVDLRSQYFKDVDAAIVVTDLTSLESIQMASTWRMDVLNHCAAESPLKAWALPVILLANKSDKISENEEKFRHHYGFLEEVGRRHGFAANVLVSAKQDQMLVYKLFRSVVWFLVDQRKPKSDRQFPFLGHDRVSLDIVREYYQRGETRVVSLVKTTIQEVDDILQLAEMMIQNLEDLCMRWATGKNSFALKIKEADLILNQKEGLRRVLERLACLIIDEDKGCSFRIVPASASVRFELPVVTKVNRDLLQLVTAYNTMVCDACQSAWQELPPLISKIEGKINEVRLLLLDFQSLASLRGLPPAKLNMAHGRALNNLGQVAFALDASRSIIDQIKREREALLPLERLTSRASG